MESRLKGDIGLREFLYSLFLPIQSQKASFYQTLRRILKNQSNKKVLFSLHHIFWTFVFLPSASNTARLTPIIWKYLTLTGTIWAQSFP